MNRADIINAFNDIAPVYNPGQHYKYDNNPFIVLKAMYEESDSSSSFGGYQKYNLLCYVPDTSMVKLDEIINRVKERVFELEYTGLEYNGTLGEDFHEKAINMYMRFVTIRVPKQTRM